MICSTSLATRSIAVKAGRPVSLVDTIIVFDPIHFAAYLKEIRRCAQYQYHVQMFSQTAMSPGDECGDLVLVTTRNHALMRQLKDEYL
jgi:hypothetical protein